MEKKTKSTSETIYSIAIGAGLLGLLSVFIHIVLGLRGEYIVHNKCQYENVSSTLLHRFSHDNRFVFQDRNFDLKELTDAINGSHNVVLLWIDRLALNSELFSVENEIDQQVEIFKDVADIFHYDKDKIVFMIWVAYSPKPHNEERRTTSNGWLSSTNVEKQFFHKKSFKKPAWSVLWHFPRSLKARKCLGQDESSSAPFKVLSNAKEFEGNFSVDGIREFINKQCGLYRTQDGNLSNIGNLLNQLESNRFEQGQKSVNRFNDMDDCPLIDASILNEKIFIEEYVGKNKPVIIKNALESWKGMHKWSNKYLLNKIGNRSVHVKLSPDGNFEGCEPLLNWSDSSSQYIPPHILQSLESPDKVLVRPATLDIRFKDFLQLIENKSISNSSTSYYLEYLSLSSYLPELINDAPPMKFANQLQLSFRNLWFSDGNTVGKVHFDPYENLMGMISGSKQFLLIDPSNNSRLYEGHIREAIMDYNQSSDTFQRTRLLESTSMVNSPVNIINPDLDQYPEFSNARIMNCHVSKGEMLYLPAFWWHEVISHPDKNDHRNLAVNYWYSPFFTKEFPCPSCPLQVNINDYHHILQEMIS